MYKIDNKYKKHRLKIWSRDWIFKNTILKKRRKRGKKERKNKQTNETNKTKNKQKKQSHKNY